MSWHVERTVIFKVSMTEGQFQSFKREGNQIRLWGVGEPIIMDLPKTREELIILLEKYYDFTEKEKERLEDEKRIASGKPR